MFCTQHRGVSPGLLLPDQEGPREGGHRAGVRLPCVIANSRGRSGEGQAAEVGEGNNTSRGPELSKPLSGEKIFIENSGAHSHGRPLAHHLRFQARG